MSAYPPAKKVRWAEPVVSECRSYQIPKGNSFSVRTSERKKKRTSPKETKPGNYCEAPLTELFLKKLRQLDRSRKKYPLSQEDYQTILESTRVTHLEIYREILTILRIKSKSERIQATGELISRSLILSTFANKKFVKDRHAFKVCEYLSSKRGEKDLDYLKDRLEFVNRRIETWKKVYQAHEKLFVNYHLMIALRENMDQKILEEKIHHLRKFSKHFFILYQHVETFERCKMQHFVKTRKYTNFLTGYWLTELKPLFACQSEVS